MSVTITRTRANGIAAQAIRDSGVPEDSPEAKGLIAVVATASALAVGVCEVKHGPFKGTKCPMVQSGLWLLDKTPSDSAFDLALAWDRATYEAGLRSTFVICINPHT
jgi:hypothetical protein